MDFKKEGMSLHASPLGIMTVMVSSHAGLSCQTSWCCGSSSGFLPVGMTAVWDNPEERLVLMCRVIFCDMNMGGAFSSLVSHKWGLQK